MGKNQEHDLGTVFKFKFMGQNQDQDLVPNIGSGY